MKAINFFCGFLGIASYFIHDVLAQDFASHGHYTEPNTGITFYTSYETNGTITGDGEFSTVSWGGYLWGVAFPDTALTVDTYEYIGIIIGSLPNGTGWAGVVHGTNQGCTMYNHLQLVAWPTGVGNQIATSFRYATGYTIGFPYGGSAQLQTMYSMVNATNWVLVYRCINCLIYDDPTQTLANTSTTEGTYEQGWSQSYSPPYNPLDASSGFNQHNNGMGVFQVIVSSATIANYASYTTLTQSGGLTVSTTVATSTFSSVPVPTATSYDYVVVGAGAAGIPVAMRLNAAGHSVLLIEKGVASSYRWGGTLRPESGWLDAYNQTWFDIPGECNRIWNGGSAGVACTDTDQMTGCILGGGAAVNAGLWWRPNPADWDYNFPLGWKSTDMVAATNRVFSIIPGTDHPSTDHQLYLLQDGFNIVKQGLQNKGWVNVTANAVGASKNNSFSYTNYMSQYGERGGPMATYLVTANKSANFHLWLNTSVERINRINGHATSLNVIPTNNGGYEGTVNLTPITGRVILAAGTFGDSKLLFRSGIGPTDMLTVVNASTDGPTMINSSYWINLPVGYNLADHLNTDTVITHPNITYYNWPDAWDTPIAADATAYLTHRTGPLTQAAPNIGPMMWDEVVGPDGILRQFQWTSRVEGSNGVPSGNAMTMSLYLGRGQVSRGRTTIEEGLNMVVSTLPWGDANDLATVAIEIDRMRAAMATVPGLTQQLPMNNQTSVEYVASVPLTFDNIGARRANHWLGTCKIGLDSGLLGGTSVVNTSTLVYGTDNIFVVDASIFPGMPSTNPSAPIVVAAEHASDLILALPLNTAIPHYYQCGGLYYTGSQACAAPYTCTYGNPYFWQCL